MSIYIYNTLTRQKEIFQPLNSDSTVNMYVCGITPYDYCHLGHSRCYFAYDLIKRYLTFKGYKIFYVQNFTDIDDKIISRANKENKSCPEISEKFIKSYFEDLDKLNIKRADIYPKVTEHIPEIIKIISGLIEKKFAYIVNGDVYYSIEKFKGYGKLSKRSLDEMLAGVRVEANENKQNPLDFALWKKSKENEPFWESPWGGGRPGWHIECSAMSMKYLGETLDIHGGAIELAFPHHENEIAQSEAYTNKQFVKYWIHNGLVTVSGQKMAKSQGNFITIYELTKKYHPEVIRLFLFQTHYRSPLDFSYPELDKSKIAYLRLLYIYHKLQKKLAKVNFTNTEEEFLSLNKPQNNSQFMKDTILLQQNFIEFMDDDFNTAKVLANIFEFVKILNKNIQSAPKEELIFAASIFFTLMQTLGFFEIKWTFEVNKKVVALLKKYLPQSEDISPAGAIKELISLRQQYRQEKNFSQADEIRKALLDLDIILEDTNKSTTWKIK